VEDKLEKEAKRREMMEYNELSTEERELIRELREREEAFETELITKGGMNDEDIEDDSHAKSTWSLLAADRQRRCDDGDPSSD
jgi:DNA-binding protein H-NS